VKGKSPEIQNMVHFISEPLIIMLISLLVASYTLGIARGKKLTAVMNVYGDAVKDISMILLIITGAGALKQVLSDSGVSQVIAIALQTVPIHPLVLGWLMAAAIRASIGSATVAGLTTAGIILPLMIQTHTNPNLMVLAVGAGSLMFSHVNDGGFWLFKEYFNLSMKDTFRSWSLMEIIIGLVGLAGVLLLNLWI
jgi:Gnt-I system high-affinity gluconate transporter